MLEASGREVRVHDLVRQIYTTALIKPATDLVVQQVDDQKGLVVGVSFNSPPKTDQEGAIRYIPPGWVLMVTPAQNN